MGVDWAAATFLDRVIHGLWLDPEDVRAKFDLAAISSRHRLLNQALIKEWREISPGADAAVIEFEFRVSGNAKRKLLRRLQGHLTRHRGGLRFRTSMSLKWLDDYALAYDVAARQCGGVLLGWRFVRSPLSE